MIYSIEKRELNSFIDIKKNLEKNVPKLDMKSGYDVESLGGNFCKIENNVGTICIDGSLTCDNNYYSKGVVLSYSLVSSAIDYLKTKNVSKIIFKFNSPGGEFGKELIDLGEKIGSLEIENESHVETRCCSSAYFLATYSQKILSNSYCFQGSIGCFATICLPDRNEKQIVSSNSPLKIASEDNNFLSIQKEVDLIGDLFVHTVSENRRVSTEKVLESFGKGSILTFKEALGVGMIDGKIPNLEENIDMKNKKSLSSTSRVNMKLVVVDDENQNIDESKVKYTFDDMNNAQFVEENLPGAFSEIFEMFNASKNEDEKSEMVDDQKMEEGKSEMTDDQKMEEKSEMTDDQKMEDEKMEEDVAKMSSTLDKINSSKIGSNDLKKKAVLKNWSFTKFVMEAKKENILFSLSENSEGSSLKLARMSGNSASLLASNVMKKRFENKTRISGRIK